MHSDIAHSSLRWLRLLSRAGHTRRRVCSFCGRVTDRSRAGRRRPLGNCATGCCAIGPSGNSRAQTFIAKRLREELVEKFMPRVCGRVLRTPTRSVLNVRRHYRFVGAWETEIASGLSLNSQNEASSTPKKRCPQRRDKVPGLTVDYCG